MNKVRTRQIAADTDIKITRLDVAGTFDSGKNYRTVSAVDDKGNPKTLNQLLEDIFTERKTPTITLPSASVSIRGAGVYEVGTEVPSGYTITENPGSYEYGPETGVTFDYSGVIVNLAPKTQSESANIQNALFTLNEKSSNEPTINVTDSMIADPIVAMVDTLKYNASTSEAADNLGDKSGKGIAAATLPRVCSSNQIKGYRQYFYGVNTATTALTSADIRALSGKGGSKAAKGQTLTINATSTTKRVVVAIPKSQTVTFKAVLASSMNADITAEFSTSTVKVQGANGATAVDYTVYIFQPATFQGNEQIKVTLS